MKIYGLRIDYSIMAQLEDGGDFEEVGFGGTTKGASLAECAHEISSNLHASLIESKSISQSQLAKAGADWEEIDRRLFQAIAKLMGE